MRFVQTTFCKKWREWESDYKKSGASASALRSLRSRLLKFQNGPPTWYYCLFGQSFDVGGLFWTVLRRIYIGAFQTKATFDPKSFWIQPIRWLDPNALTNHNALSKRDLYDACTPSESEIRTKSLIATFWILRSLLRSPCFRCFIDKNEATTHFFALGRNFK